MNFGRLTYREIKAAAEKDWVVLVPTGCTEQQGVHLPVDFDTWLAGKLCRAASARAAESYQTDSLVLPPLPFGPTPEHKGFEAGYIHLPQELHERVYHQVLSSLVEQGFQRMIIWQGCGRHQLTAMVEKFLADQPASVQIFLPEMPFQAIWDGLVGPQILGGHAASFATSLCLHFRPEDVRKDLIINPDYSMPDWSSDQLDLSKHTSTGTIGDLSASSADLGKELWAALVEACAAIIHDFDQRSKEIQP